VRSRPDLILSSNTGLVRGAKDQSIDKEFSYFKMNNLSTKGKFELTNLVKVDATNEELLKYSLQAGDFIFNTRNSVELVGKCGVLEHDPSEPVIFNNNLLRITFRHINPRIISFWFNSADGKSQLRSVTSATTSVAAIYQKALIALEVLIPPLAEQKVIADKLDELLAQVESTKARLDAIPAILKSFRQSVLAAAVSGELTNSDTTYWENTKIDDLVKVVNGKAFPSKDYQENGIRLLKPGNLHMSGVVVWNLKNTTYIPEAWKDKRPELILKEGALLMNLTAQSLADEFLGRVCVFNEQSEVTLLNQRICYFESKLKYDIKPYLYIFFKSPQFRAYVDTLDSGTLIKHLNIKNVKSYTIQLPDELEQTEIVRRVEELFAFADKVEAQVNAAQLRVNNLTQSILAKAFRGELTADWRAANPELISGDNSAEALLERIKAEREALATKKKPTKKASIRKKA
jgi:type I restriction enzyme S subunit